MTIYTTPPGPRMAYDVDGTVVLYVQASAVINALTAPQAAAINTESLGANYPRPSSIGWLTLIFPELRDIAGYTGCWQSGAGYRTSGNVETSSNTTTGADGTWTQIGASYAVIGTVVSHRSITTQAATNVHAIRFQQNLWDPAGGNSIRFIHVFGNKSAAGDYLEFWHPTSDLPYGILDAGDPVAGSTTTYQVRLKNRSSTLTANTISVADDVPTEQTPAVDAQWTISTDNAAFTESISIASIAPGAISPIFYVKAARSTTSTLGPRVLRLRTTTTSWT